jgi:hypothetical protein
MMLLKISKIIFILLYNTLNLIKSLNHLIKPLYIICNNYSIYLFIKETTIVNSLLSLSKKVCSINLRIQLRYSHKNKC